MRIKNFALFSFLVSNVFVISSAGATPQQWLRDNCPTKDQLVRFMSDDKIEKKTGALVTIADKTYTVLNVDDVQDAKPLRYPETSWAAAQIKPLKSNPHLFACYTFGSGLAFLPKKVLGGNPFEKQTSDPKLIYDEGLERFVYTTDSSSRSGTEAENTQEHYWTSSKPMKAPREKESVAASNTELSHEEIRKNTRLAQTMALQFSKDISETAQKEHVNRKELLKRILVFLE
ncbi:MAG: hypothetical protein H2057_04325 [Alphaproteobacteria bacterium]|nr:hypothetical protein [Alphaproteobacteria bacterium]